MRASICVIFVIVAYTATISASPLPQDDPEERQPPKEQLRGKRQFLIGTVPSTTTVLGPSRTVLTSAPLATQVITSPQVVAAPAPVRVSTSAIAVPAAPTHSFVYQSGPDYTYYIHQRHNSGHYYTTHYNNYYDPYYYNYNYNNYYPAYASVQTVPAVASLPTVQVVG